MAQLVSDTLKQRGGGDFPIAYAKDIQLENGNSVEDSIYDEVYVGESIASDSSAKLWLDNSTNFNVDKLDIIANYEEYSEEEIVIGQYKGKPLYRTTYYGKPNDTNASTSTITYVISNSVKATDVEVVNIDGIIINDTNSMVKSSYYRASTNFFSVDTAASGVRILRAGQYLLEYKITVEYTKKSDPDDSFSPTMIKTYPSYKKSVVADFEDYSTEERVVGRWIDGRPLYRKCFSGKSPSTTSDAAIGYVPADADLVINLDGFTIVGSGRLPINWYGGSTYNTITQVRYDQANRPIQLRLSYSGWCNLPCYCWIEYTKTTDEANSFDPSMLTYANVKLEATDEEVSEVLGL